ncbi:hypothetical protein FOCC_FOCC007340 [Frankliniella occidentalis]|nr:hypothetical protein FOCC_FOCC007340 [Frankliniella occidentalis]
MSCFLREYISEEDFERGERALRRYVLTIEDVYGTNVLMKFNTHLLLHIPQSVKNFGALWASSTFSYEHYNGMLAKMFRSSQAVPLQICKNYVRFQGVKDDLLKLVERNNVPLCVTELLQSLSSEKHSLRAVKGGDLVLFGAPQYSQLNVISRNAIETLLGTLVDDSKLSVAFKPESIRKKCLLTFYPNNAQRYLCYPLVYVLERD